MIYQNDLFILSLLGSSSKGVTVDEIVNVATLTEYKRRSKNLHCFRILVYSILQRLEKRGFVSRYKDRSFKTSQRNRSKYRYYLTDKGFQELIINDISLARKLIEVCS
jgi:hypothetical protein